MKLKEYLENVNIFDEIMLIEPFPFLTVSNSPVLNSLLMLFHGNKEVYSDFVNVEPDYSAKLIVAQYQSSWENYLQAEIELSNLGNVRTISEDIEDSETTTQDNEKTDQISAYNSETFVNDGKETSTNSGTRENGRIRTLTESNKDAKLSYDLLTNEGKQSLNSRIIKDISEFYSLAIY